MRGFTRLAIAFALVLALAPAKTGSQGPELPRTAPQAQTRRVVFEAFFNPT